LKIINSHSTFDEVKSLLDNLNTRDQTLAQLKVLDPVNDEVKGLISFLQIHNWNYSSVQESERKAQQHFLHTLQTQERKNTKVWLKIAAVLLPLIGIVTLFYILSSSPTKTDQLFTQYTVPEIGLPNLMSTASEKQFDEAMAAFKDKAYNEAKQGFEVLLQESPKNDTLNYFIAYSEMKLSHFEKAISHFESVVDTSVFKEKADFHLALCNIKMKALKEAKLILQKMGTNSNHSFYSEANEILKEPVFQ